MATRSNGPDKERNNFRVIIPAISSQTTFEDIFRITVPSFHNGSNKNGDEKQKAIEPRLTALPIKIKKLNLPGEVTDALRGMEVEFDQATGCFIGRMPNLERSLYVKVDEALNKLGGKWNRKLKGHVFKTDPRTQLEDVAEAGVLEFSVDGFVPTPRPVVVDRILPQLPRCLVGKIILEPSAGEGHIADVIQERGGTVICVEISPERAAILRKKGYLVVQGNFLKVNALPLPINGVVVICPGGTVDGVAMNPPFENLNDIRHVMHAFGFLRQPDDPLVAIMSESPFFRADKLAAMFREWLGEVGGYSSKLPEGSFKVSGVGINTRVVVVVKGDADQADDQEAILEGVGQINAFLQRMLQPLPVEVLGETTEIVYHTIGFDDLADARRYLKNYLMYPGAAGKISNHTISRPYFCVIAIRENDNTPLIYGEFLKKVTPEWIIDFTKDCEVI